MRTKMIIMRYLDSYPGAAITSHKIQIDIPVFALNVYGKTVNPETVAREWRKLRDDKATLQANGYSIIESLESKGKEKTFIIRRNLEVHRDSSGITKESGSNNPPNRSEEIPESRDRII